MSDSDTLYDPPIRKAARGRSASFSAPAYDPPPPRRRSASLPRRQSFSDPRPPPGSHFTDGEKQLQTPLTRLYDDLDRSKYSDEEEKRLKYRSSSKPYDGPGAQFGVGPSAQDSDDELEDRRMRREGRQSRNQEEPPTPHSADMEHFLAQCYDLTHAIDEVENSVDQILAFRNKIVSLKPHEDVGQVSLKADMHALSALTTTTGKKIVALETWLVKLHDWCWNLRRLVKSGQVTTASASEVGEMKFQLSSAKLDFADCMDRIREGAWKEQERRERTRIWMARHMRVREPEIEDQHVRTLLKKAELGAAEGVAQHDVASYAGLWALRNPFTELAELTHGMSFLHNDLDRDIVDTVTGQNTSKRVIDFDQPAATVASAQSPMLLYKYNQNKLHAEELDFEYGFAKKVQLQRQRRRKAMVLSLLLVVIAGLVLVIIVATIDLPSDSMLGDE